MKTVWLSLCTGLMLAAASAGAQAPAPTSEPFLYVYVVRYGENVLPRIALGLEKPSLKIYAFEKCVRISETNPKLVGMAIQLKTDDTKALIAAIKTLGAPDARELPTAVLWFTTPDNKALDFISTQGTSGVEANLVKGVIELDADGAETTLRYLNGKVHLD